MDKSLMLNRIKKHLGFDKDAEFARYLDIKPNTLSNWYKRGTFDAELLYTKCDFLSSSWLLTNQGEMLSNFDKSVNKLSGVSGNGKDEFLIPLYNAEASAGIGQLLLSNEYIIDKLKVPFARDEDIALTIVGDSMTPAMQSGDIAVVRSMPNWKEYLDYGNIFIVVTENEIYCKIVQKNTEKDIFTLKSYNTNYNEFEIPKKFISQIYKVIGIISQRSY